MSASVPPSEASLVDAMEVNISREYKQFHASILSIIILANISGAGSLVPFIVGFIFMVIPTISISSPVKVD
ncbi:hypothetical protein EXIGLDRAFT_775773 [Exidia glandulosa HHB12029]|uniref:Uncharacterized protein n=1 Tax=Exidia glandulosa HHB12029 TaxID=1314781 RepID=A0A165DS50_EXIGL|nr:hypothetical protein EXIGLDRAFT_775773 [Exidia glandulosa HHB12029]